MGRGLSHEGFGSVTPLKISSSFPYAQGPRASDLLLDYTLEMNTKSQALGGSHL